MATRRRDARQDVRRRFRQGRAPIMRVLIGGVGYRNLRDYSAGVNVTDALASRQWATGVVVEDLSYNPIAVVQRLDDERGAFQRIILVGAVDRGADRPFRMITAYRWDGVLPARDEIQGAVADAVTGIISLDNLLIVAHHFGALPPVVVVVEVKPFVEAFGEVFSPAVAAAFPDVCALVARLATDDDAVQR